MNEITKPLLDTFCRDLTQEHAVMFLFIHDDADVRRVTLIARPSVSYARNRNFHSKTSIRDSMTSRGTSAGQNATISRTAGRPSPYPVAPGGPPNTSGISSRVKRSTSALLLLRTPIRSCTSGIMDSSIGGAAAP